MNPSEAQSWYEILYTLALEWWVIRTIGVTFASYGSRMLYRSHLYNTTKFGNEKVEKMSKGIVVSSHFFYSILFGWLARRVDILENDVVWDLFIIEFILFLSFSLAIYGTWERGIAPLSDKYIGTKFTKKK